MSTPQLLTRFEQGNSSLWVCPNIDGAASPGNRVRQSNRCRDQMSITHSIAVGLDALRKYVGANTIHNGRYTEGHQRPQDDSQKRMDAQSKHRTDGRRYCEDIPSPVDNAPCTSMIAPHTLRLAGSLPVKLCYRYYAESRETGEHEHHASDTRHRQWRLV